MKYQLLVLVFSARLIIAAAQPGWVKDPEKQQLYQEISRCNYVETQFKGFDGISESNLWKKAFSFFEDLPVRDILFCLSDSSHVLRYYAFLKLLDINNRVAFEKIKDMVSDTSMILYWFNDFGGEERFNRLLLREYRFYIELRYLKGGACTLPDQHFLGEYTYRFPKASKNKWKIILEQFDQVERAL